MPRSRQLIAVLATVTLAGCMTVPLRYRQPAQVYSPAIDEIAVHGYERTAFYPTSAAQAAFIAPQLGIYAAGGGVSGEYRLESDAGMFRYFLEDTRCARRVTLGDTGAVTAEGMATAEERVEPENVLINAVMLVPSILGAPLHDDAYGLATARVYRNGELLTSVSSEARLSYWTSLYTAFRDRDRAMVLARGMALRVVADDLAERLCGRQGTADIPH